MQKTGFTELVFGFEAASGDLPITPRRYRASDRRKARRVSDLIACLFVYNFVSIEDVLLCSTMLLIRDEDRPLRYLQHMLYRMEDTLCHKTSAAFLQYLEDEVMKRRSYLPKDSPQRPMLKVSDNQLKATTIKLPLCTSRKYCAWFEVYGANFEKNLLGSGGMRRCLPDWRSGAFDDAKEYRRLNDVHGPLL